MSDLVIRGGSVVTGTSVEGSISRWKTASSARSARNFPAGAKNSTRAA